ncbi:hypothetical protein Tco_1385025 [Tanacetum coccineum]
MDADRRRALGLRIVRPGKSSNPELVKQRQEEMRRRFLANGGPLPGSIDWVLAPLTASKGFQPERRSGYKSINTGEASCAVARLGYHVKFKAATPVKVTYKPAQPRRKKNADGTTSPHPDEARLSALPPLSNPYLEDRRRNHLMALSAAGIDWPPHWERPTSPAAADAGNISTLPLHFTCLYSCRFLFSLSNKAQQEFNVPHHMVKEGHASHV